MKTKYKVFLGLAGVTIIALLVALLVMVAVDGQSGGVDSGDTRDVEFAVPENEDYSKYEADYDMMYSLVEYAKAHPEEAELNQYVDTYLDKIDSMARLLPIEHTLSDDAYSFYNITNGSARPECPVFCVYIEASTPYMYDEALAELGRVSKYPVSEYKVLKNILYMPIGEPDPEP